MILADLGADVIRVDRPGGQPLAGGAHDLHPRPAERGARPQAPRTRSPPCSTWSSRPTCWSRACGPASPNASASAPTSAWPATPAGLRPDDRLGPGRAAGPDGRPRHRTTSRSPARSTDWARTRRGRTSRATSSATSAAVRPTWSSGSWPRCSRRGPRGQGQVVDAAIVDGIAHLNAMTSAFRRVRDLARSAPRPARRRRPLLRRLRDRRRRAHERSARSSRSSTTPWSTRSGSGDLPAATTPPIPPRCASSSPRRSRADPGGVGRALRGHRRLRGPGRDAQRGARPPPPAGPGPLRRGGRDRAAPSGAALLAHSRPA